MADNRLRVYKCRVCGNVVELIHDGGGTLVCCGVPMDRLTENTTDAAQEKHVPVIETLDGGRVRVAVGEVAHPMEEKHYIEWIELIADGTQCRRFLGPGDAPEAVFPVEGEKITARALCNLHGLWRTT